jgi:predicted TIM-barrel fold metal-dependent hydrolase
MRVYKRLVEDPVEDISEALCEEFGVDYPILNTTARLDAYPEEERALQMMSAINNMMLDRFLDDHDHIFGLMTLAMRRPEKAVEEIDRLASEKKIVGLYVNPGGQHRALGDPCYDPIYRVAENYELPIVYHGSGGGLRWECPGVQRALDKYLSVHTLEHPWGMMLTLTSLIVQGVPEKFPDLDFVFLESGIGWVPYMMYRLNREYSQRRSDAPLLTRSSEEYIRESCYFATQPLSEPNNPDHIRQLIDQVGADSIVFSTDHPHFDADNPSAITRYLSHLSAADQRKILSGNALDIFPRLKAGL